LKRAEDVKKAAEREAKLVKGEDSDDDDGEEMSMMPAPGVEMTDKERRLWELRMRMKKSRKQNHKEVVNEAKGRLDAAQGKKRTREYDKRADKFKGDEKKDDRKLHITAEEAAAAEERNATKKKKSAAWGWDAFNQNTLYKAYDKRLEGVRATDTDVERQKAEMGAGFYDSAAALNYGQTSTIPEENMNRMVAELVDKNARSRNFSRRRAFNEEADVDYINKRNAHFNKKVERAYGEFTKEIKLNLERGTAL